MTESIIEKDTNVPEVPKKALGLKVPIQQNFMNIFGSDMVIKYQIKMLIDIITAYKPDGYKLFINTLQSIIDNIYTIDNVVFTDPGYTWSINIAAYKYVIPEDQVEETEDSNRWINGKISDGQCYITDRSNKIFTLNFYGYSEIESAIYLAMISEDEIANPINRESKKKSDCDCELCINLSDTNKKEDE